MPVSDYLTVGMGILLVCSQAARPASVTTQHNDNGRTGLNASEHILTATNVSGGKFHRLFSLPVDGQIYAQPLYLPSVTLPGQGVHNVLYVATMNNSVYAYDADSGIQTPLWQVNLGTPVLCAQIQYCSGTAGGGFGGAGLGNVGPKIGVLSTPVIDPGSGTIYVVAETFSNGTATFGLHALEVRSGIERTGSPVVIGGKVNGTAEGAIGMVTFDAKMHWQRPALLLSNGVVYVAFASHQDSTPAHGWIFGYDSKTLEQTAIRCLTPNGEMAGIWQGGAGLAADQNGDIYAVTGNGDFDSTKDNYGQSIVKMNPAARLSVTGYFSPSNELALNSWDGDLGSGGPLLIPGTSYLVAGGKDGRMFLTDTANLGGFFPADKVIQEWRATTSQATPGSSGGGIFGGNVFYNSSLYVWGATDVVRQYRFDGKSFSLLHAGPDSVKLGYTDEPAMSISSDGAAIGTGILWASYSVSGHSDGNPYPGILRAYDAADISHELWNSGDTSSPDYSGSWAKWCAPTIANGRVYLATLDNIVNVFGLRPAVTVADQMVTYDGTPKSSAVTTDPANLAVTVTYNGMTAPPSTAGTYTVVATITALGYIGSATGTLTIAKAPGTVNITSATESYGSVAPVLVSTKPVGLHVAVAYNGRTVLPTAVGTYSVTATIDDPNYSGTGTGTLTIAKATPVLTWPQPAAITVGAALGAAQLNATANVPGTFIYSPVAGTVLPLGNGQNLSAQFTPSDSVDYNSGSITTTITVNAPPAPIAQTISFAPLNAASLGTTPIQLTATASSGLSVSFVANTPAVCTVSSSTLTLVALGTCSIAASQAGNSTYLPAPPVVRSFAVTQATQAITFGTLPSVMLSVTVNLSAIASSGLPVSFTSLTPAVCTVNASTVTPLAPGVCSIMATQAGNTNYAPAAPMTQSFNVTGTPGITAPVSAVAQTIVFAPLSDQTLGAPPFALAATASSGLPVSFVSNTNTVCTVSGVTVTIVSAGTCSITASQGGNPQYAAAAPVMQTFTIKNPQTAGPSIKQGGINPLYSSSTSIQPGSWVSIYGANLANSSATWNGDFPTSLGGVSVTINGKYAYLWSISPTQINLQAPDDTTTGPVNVVLTNGIGSISSTVILAPVSPSFSLLADGVHVAGVIPTPDQTGNYGGGTYDLIGPLGAFGFSTRPVKKGESLILFGVGFGPTNPTVPAGRVFSGAVPATNQIAISIGGIPADVAFAGITAAGLYQFNIIVPNTASGDQPVNAVVDGIRTQAGPLVAVQ
jgi:uncharacterized protein (TIGR03437 family)